MKVLNMVRWQLVLAGLAALMFITPSAHSQEITNTVFDDGPNVTTFSQPSAAERSAEPVPVAAAVPSMNEVASIQASLATNHRALIDSPWVTAGLTLLLFTCIALSAIGESKRLKRNGYASRRYPSYRGA
jgi:hypothetical protein